MAKKKQQPAESTRTASHGTYAFWQGQLTFGLVSVPVHLFPATRNGGLRTRLVSPDRVPLARRYFRPGGDAALADDDIVRGYELEDGSHIPIEDSELEAVEPRKSREIDLRTFVLLSDIPVAFFERAYYLTPANDVTKAYRLLADILEKTGRAGIATFVMREREHLIAIYARHGILCGEALRFADELRTPESIGLPEAIDGTKASVASFKKLIDGLMHRSLVMEDLVDVDSERLRRLVEKKRRAGRDVIKTASSEVVEDEDEVDLLETIRLSLQSKKATSSSVKRTAASKRSPKAPAKSAKRRVGTRADPMVIPIQSARRRPHSKRTGS